MIATGREVLRLLGQAISFSLRGRSLGLALFLVIGGIVVLVVAVGTFLAPVLVYPLL